jgi:hypothetical protein
MLIKELLVERVINAFTPEDKMKYGQEVWDIMQRSYAEVPGGFGTADDIPDLIQKGDLWKMVVRDGVVTAACIYRDQFGRKAVASGTNGTIQGLRDYKMIKTEDRNFQRSWAEVSGKPELAMVKAGFKPLPHKFAAILCKKPIIELNPDGYHYSRIIAGDLHEKIIYGSIQVTPELAQQLTAMGIQLHELPMQFKS